jgi:hypothetical protein
MKRLLSRSVATFALLAVLLGGILVLPPAETEAQRGAWTRIVVRHSRRCMDVRASSRRNRAVVQQYRCKRRGPNQRWRLIPAGQGNFFIVNRNSGKCLDVRGASTRSGAQLQQSGCKGGSNQQFRLVTSSRRGWYNIVAAHSGMCLDVKSAGRGNRARIQQYPCKDSTNQQWRLRTGLRAVPQ